MKFILLLLFTIPFIASAQLTKLAPTKTKTLSEIVRKKGIAVASLIQNVKEDTVSYSLVMHCSNGNVRVIDFNHDDSIINKMCSLFRHYLKAPYHTNDTYTLGDGKITLAAERVKGNPAVMIINERGILTLTEHEAENLFCF